MTTNPAAKTILCYGDSNTWGQTPDKSVRYPVDVRWTGLLQHALGDQYSVIEEGLGGRTTNLEHPRKPGRNGMSYLRPCLESHSPIDLVVLMLGTNDLKIEFGRSPADVAGAIEELLALIHEKTQTRVLLVSPANINDEAPDFAKYYIPDFYDHESAIKSQQLGVAYKTLAQRAGCGFFDASTVSQAGTDGIHFTPEAHSGLAHALTQDILAMRLATE